ncbi:uncharacterized protein LOC100161176 [Acyrthosiphon pisum]|uniref:DUF4773 domain-containing protein n=1 Tax=Acyrthosiphon pisum TaxID=7029 RepID=A0A8R1W3E2_ACYPI|nr:uncharacterized protein LOC100161176 [Acyrthosiphon pisum]|eukprot:XP_001952532.2 PREDICTED: uncharacterized protein LOC100161176 [Acyrthosiphon pisum]
MCTRHIHHSKSISTCPIGCRRHSLISMITARLIVLSSALVIIVPGHVFGNEANNVLSTNFSPESREITYPCKCQESKCSCCSGNILQNFNLNIRQRLCTNITYNADDFEFNVRILFNDYTVYNRDVSGRNPRPICVPIFPPAWTRSRVCLKFSNLYFVGRNVHMCLSMEAQTEKKPVFAVDFNCVRMGTMGVALLKPEDGGGLEPPLPDDPADAQVQGTTATTAAVAVAAADPTTSSTVVKKINNAKPPRS